MVGDGHLQAFVVDARARTTVDVRRRRRWLRRQLDEDRSFADVAADALATGAQVDVLAGGGRTYRGCLVTASPEVLAVTMADGGSAWIRSAALVGLQVRGHSDADVHATTVPSAGVRCLDDVLVALAEQGRAVVLVTGDGVEHRGRIVGVGRDVVWIDDGPHLRTPMVTEVVAPA